MTNNESIFRTVYIPKDKADMLSIRSLLAANEIGCFVKNENVQDLMGIGQIGAGFNVVTGRVEIQVRQEDFEDAVDILKEYLGAESNPRIRENENEENGIKETFLPTGEEKSHNKYSISSLILSLMWFFGVGSFFAIILGIKALKLKEPKSFYAKAGIVLGVTGLILSVFYYFNVK